MLTHPDFQANCTSEVLADCALGYPEPFPLSFPVTFSEFPEFLDTPDTDMSAEPTTVQGYACTDGTTIDATVPARENRPSVTSHRALPTGDEKRGELSVEEACSDANLERFTKGLDRELGKMARSDKYSIKE